MTPWERLFLALALAPLAAGGLLTLFLTLGLAANPPLEVALEGDAAGLLLTAGGALTVLLLPVALGAWVARVWRERAVESALNSLAKQRYDFLERLDHELKNPLMAIVGQLDNLAARAPDPPPQALAILQSQTDRLCQLVRSLRRLVEIETCSLGGGARWPGGVSFASS
jgi:signal transduction histidine kinase